MQQALEAAQGEEAETRMPHRLPLLSIFLTNARSLVNKIDELQSQIAYNHYIHDCCLLIVSESWLCPYIPSATVELAGHTFHHCDRTEASGKSMGGCSDSRVIDTHCSPDFEAMSVQRAHLDDVHVIAGHFKACLKTVLPKFH